MKKWIVLFMLLAALPVCALEIPNAQKIAGKWQGALKTPNGQLRIVIEVVPDADRLKANFYSIDQQSPAIPASTVAWNGSTFKLAITAINGSYEGKMNADGNSISGTWSQGGGQMPLDLARATPETAWAIPEPPPPPKRMASAANPGFEVATIKPSDPSRPGKLFTIRGSEIITINTSLSDLLKTAYDLHPRQITGAAPSWLDSELYDVTGRPDTPGQPNVAQMKAMLQKLLADRFQLKFHRDKKELSVYTLTVLKGGPKLTKSARDPNGLPGLFFTGPFMSFNVTNATLADVASVLQTILDKPVVDQTGLTEKYDFVLRFTPDPGQFPGAGGAPPAAAETGDEPPDLFTAMQQQLGLKLESAKAPADVIVIDQVAKPSEN